LVVAAAGVLAAVAATGAIPRAAGLILRMRTRIALERLLDGLPPERLPAARFSAIPAPRIRAAARGPAAAAALRSEGLAGSVLSMSVESTSPDAVEASAAALAIKGEAGKAIPLLEAAVAQRPGDARLWNDLAAAQLETGRPLRALVAADAALRIEPQSVDALYNRALILDRLGLTPVAAEAWRACLDAGPDPTAAAVIRDRLRNRGMASERDRWPAAERDFLAAAAAGDEATVQRIAEEFPALLRASAEGVYLAKWAEAAGTDPARADPWLRAARSAGAVLRHGHETLLAEAVDAIDTAIAQRDSGRLLLLIRGHLAYDRGRRAYNPDRDYARAESELRRAAAAFHGAGSPMEQVARSYIGSVLIEATRYDEACEILTGLVAAERTRTGHRALLANGEYLLALCDTFRGRWNAAVEHTTDSAALFRELGERANAATSETMLAALLDLLGQRDAGWEVRRRVFETTSAVDALNRVLPAVGTGTRAAMRAGDWDLALSLADVESSLAGHVRSPLLSADLLTRRAVVQHERRAFDDRDLSLERARTAIGAIPDANERERLTIELHGAEAIAVRDSDPRRAIELLDRAVAFSEQTRRRFVLPLFLLQRGRAWLAAGDEERAWQDFSTAMDELEAQRSAIAALSLRARMFDTAEELFDQAIALAARRGNAEDAFRVAERARARELLDALGGATQPTTSSSEVASRLEPGTLLVEYAVLPDRLVIFAIRRDGMRMHVVPVSRDELASREDLGEILLGPIRDEVATTRRLIIIPDRILQRTAFGALPWNGQFLARTHVISEAPSASRLVAASGTDEPREKTVLIVGNPTPDPERKLGALPSIRHEIAEIRAAHRRARVLFDAEATKARFMLEALQYDVLHFSGHGLSDEDSLTPALLFSGDSTASARMDSTEIASLKLPRKPLVVLAACGTLRGRVAGVEGMPSLARSFLLAGASAVVGTLTDIDDAQATALLASFHRHIAAGARPADALHKAQLEAMARGGAAADPANWAQFVVYTSTL
jgi:tetratricopeptide (TPR) repeat protein